MSCFRIMTLVAFFASCLLLLSKEVNADSKNKIVLDLLSSISVNEIQSPFLTTSVFYYEIKKAIKKLELGASALSDNQRQSTFHSLARNVSFQNAVLELLQVPDEYWTCDRFENVEIRPPACSQFPEQTIPNFPQTISFPGQIGRVNRFGYFQSYSEAVFTRHHYGEIVALLDSNRRLLCSAFLIDDHTLLTAAHCACHPKLEMAYIGRNIDAIDRGSLTQVRVLTSDAKYFNENFCNIYDSSEEISQYNLVDLAILKVQRPFLLPPNFRKLNFNVNFNQVEMSNIIEDTRTFFLSVGFGDTDISDRGGVKNVVIQHNFEKCTNKNRESLGCYPEFEFASTTQDVPVALQTDTCNGDSGGSFLVSNTTLGVDFLLVGVIARGIGGGSERCGRGGVYVNLLNQSIRNWIERNIN